MGKIRERIIAYILVFCTLVSAICTGITMPVFAAEDGTAKGSITISNYRILVRDSSGKWVDLTDDMTVRNGDQVMVLFDWELDDSETQPVEFDTVISPIQGVTFGKSDPADLPHADSVDSVGVYWIDETVFHIELTNDDYIKKSGRRYGGAEVIGVINVADEGDKADIQIGDVTVRPNFTTDKPTSEAYFSKSAVGNLVKTEDGTYRQTFQLKIETAWNKGKITVESLEDVLPAGLTNMSDFKVVSCSNCDLFEEGKSYPFEGSDGIKEILKGEELGTAVGEGNTVIIFEYTADVSPEYVENALKKDFGGAGDNYKNTATLQYENSNGEEKTEQRSAFINPLEPSINKSGRLSDDGKSIIWTITINLNGIDLDDIASIKDIPGLGLKNSEEFELKNLIPDPFKPTGNPGEYVYEYSTEIDEKYITGTNRPTITIKNNVELTMTNGNTHTATGEYTLEGNKDWVKKEVAGTGKDEEGNFLIYWKVTLDIPNGVSNVRLKDWPDPAWNLGQHKICGNIYAAIAGEEPQLVIENASRDAYGSLNGTIKAGNTIVPANENDNGTLDYNIWNDSIYFYDSLAGKTVEVYYTTKVTSSSVTNIPFVNYAQGFYTFAGSEQESDEVSETWESRAALSKRGDAQDDNSIKYTLIVDLTKLEKDELQKGGVIEITDTFPEDLVFKKLDSSRFSLIENGKEYDQDIYGFDGPTVTYKLAQDGRSITFTVVVDDHLFEYVNEKGPSIGDWGVPGLSIHYTLELEDEAKVDFVRKGQPQDFTNSAEGTFRGSSIGSTETTTTLTPSPVVSKEGEYNPSSRFINYEIEINKDALDLSEGDWLYATDELGSALSYDRSSIHVFEWRDGDWKELADTDYKYTYSLENNSLSFTLPDEKHLKITYSTWINLPPLESLNENNASNSFRLSGDGLNAMEAGKKINATVSNAWAADETITISIYKYYNNEGNMEPLGDAVFTIVAMKEDESGKLVEDRDSGYWTGITVNGQGECTIGEGDKIQLVRNRIYRLIETQAPDRYKIGDPIDFVILGRDTKPEDLEGIYIFNSGAEILYENFPDETGTLTVQKTLEGLDWSDFTEGEISFKVSKDNSDYEESFSIDPSKLSSSEVYSHTILGLEPGTYTVTETVETKDGYTCSTTYTVRVGSDQQDGDESTEASVEVEAGRTTTVHFTNTYTSTQEFGSLTLTKTIAEGGPTWGAIRGTLSFVISYEGDADFPKSTTIEGTLEEWTSSGNGATYTLDNLPPGKYTVEEIVKSTDVMSGTTEYVLTMVTYEIDNSGQKIDCTNNKVSSAVSITKDGDSASVVFENTYAANRGTLILRKQVNGIDSKDAADAEAAWEAVRKSLTFVVSKYDPADDDYKPYSPYESISGDDTRWEFKEGYAVLELTNLPVGIYKVEETSGILEDYNYSMKEIVCVVDSEGVTIDGASAEGIDVTRGANVTVTYTNTYISNNAKLELEKTVSGIVDGEGNPVTDAAAWEAIYRQITFEISDETKTITVNGTDDGWELDSTSHSYKYKVPLTAGTYTIKETITDINGYTLKTVTYTVKTGESGTITQTGSTNTTSNIEVKPSSSDVKVSFNNEYEQHKGTLVLTKEVTGLSDDVLKALIDGSKIKFTIQNVETKKVYTFTLSAFKDNEDGTYTLMFDGESGNQEKLPAGTYTITESDFTLDNYQTKVTYEVKPEDSQGPEGTGTEFSFIIKKDQQTEVTFSNEYTKDPGKLTLQKTVTGDLDWDDVKDTFSIVIDYEGSEGDPKFPMTIEGNDPRWTMSSENVYTLTLEGLEPRDYTVTETFNEEKTGYTRTTTYTVNNTDSEQGVTVTVTSNTTGEVDIENSYSQDKGKLKITKTIVGLDEDADAKNTVVSTIKFVVTNTDTGEQVEEYSLSTFGENSGLYTIEIPDLPVGNYTVEETAYTVDGYIVESITYEVNSNGETTLVTNGGEPGPTPAVVIEKGETTTIDYVDTYEVILPDTGKLILQKLVIGDLSYDRWDDIKGTLSFEVKDSQGKKVEGSPFAASKFTYNDDYKAYVLEIPNLTPGEYTVTELIDGKVTGYTCSLTTYTIGSGATTGLPYDEEIGVKVDVSANEDNQVVFTNTYTLDKGNLKITKTVESDVPIPEDQLKAITFTVTNNATQESHDYTLEDFDHSGGIYTKILENLAVGDYTVTETQYDMDGFVTKSITYQINGNGEVELVKEGKPTDQTAPTATVEKGQTTTVTYKDVYKAIPKGSLVIEKIVNGLNWEKLPEYISFTVTGPNGYKRTITADEFNKNGNSYTYTIDDLEMGEYTVTENITQEEKGYTRTTSYVVGTGNSTTEGEEATVELTEDAQNGKVTFYNDYEQNKGSLLLTKVVTGLSAEELSAAINAGKIEFVIKNKDTNKEYPYTLVNFTSNGNGSYTLKLEGEKSLPEGEYVIIESNFDLPNYQTGITFEVKEGASGSGNEVSITIDKDITTEVTITNTYTSTKGSLVIEKQVTRDPNSPIIGWEDVKKYLTFEIREVGGDYVETISADLFTDEDGDGIYSYTITGLDVGKSYIIRETSSAVPDYSCEVIYVVSGSAERFNETEAKATVSATEGATVKFINYYTYVKEDPSPSPSSPAPSPDPSPSPSVTPTPSPTPTPSASPKPSPKPSPSPSPIKQLEVSPTPSPSPLPEDGSVLAAERDRVPQTSDYFFMWLSLFFVSMSSLMGYLVYLDKKNRKD